MEVDSMAVSLWPNFFCMFIRFMIFILLRIIGHGFGLQLAEAPAQGCISESGAAGERLGCLTCS